MIRNRNTFKASFPITLAEKQLKPRNNIHMRLCEMWPLMLLAEDVYSAISFII